jgi:DNA (cytosine-5)-methyltransferase 1
MGLPDGWVTDTDLGLASSEQLTALGNGVVPAQAAHALRALLAIVSLGGGHAGVMR